MSEQIANNIANSNGIDQLIRIYAKSKDQIYINLIRYVLTYQTS
jgi:hypothetical protein